MVKILFFNFQLFGILVLLLATISCSQAFSLSDLTDRFVNDKYATFKTPVNLICTFTYTVLLSDPNGVTLDSTEPPANIFPLIDKNDTHSLYKILIDLPVGSASIILKVSNILATDMDLELPYTCTAPPSTIDIKLINPNNRLVYKKSVGQLNPYLIFKVNNFYKSTPPELTLEFPFVYYAGYTTIGSQYYVIQFRPNGMNSFEDFEMTVSYLGSTSKQNYQITALPPPSQYDKAQVNYDFFPLGADNTTSYGNIFSILSVNTNNTNLISYYETLTGSVFPKPVKSDSITGEIIYYNIFSRPSFDKNLSITTFFDESPTNYMQMINYTNENKFYFNDFNTLIINSNPQNTFSFSLLTNATFQYDVNGGYLGTVNYPYGYVNGTARGYYRYINYFLSPYSLNNKIQISNLLIHEQFTVTSGIQQDNQAPVLQSIDIFPLTGSSWVIARMNITDNLSGFNRFVNIGNYQDIVSGDHNNGIYEFYLNLKRKNAYTIFNQFCDFANNCISINLLDYINVDLDIIKIQSFNISAITNIEYEFNNIDVSEKSFDNRIFIYVNKNDNQDYNPVIYHYLTKGQLEYIIVYSPIFGIWNDALGRFEFPVTIDKNTIPGTFEFLIDGETMIWSSYLETIFPSATLNITSAKGDMFAPVITDIQLPQGQTITIDPNQDYTFIEWLLTIVDEVNGFKNGQITIISDSDFVRYNFSLDNTTLVRGGNDKEAQYLIRLPVYKNCKSQYFSIAYVYLEDKNSYFSDYQNSTIYSYISHEFNSMFKLTKTIGNYGIQTVCENSDIDTTPPKLNEFVFTPEIINPFAFDDGDRTITYQVSVMDISGLLLSSLPVVYLQDHSTIVVEQPCVLEPSKSNSTYALYTCTVITPFGFGYPNGIKSSIYGFVDNKGNFNGFPISVLEEAGINTLIQVEPQLSLGILSCTDISRLGTPSVVIRGKGILPLDRVEIDYGNGTISNIRPKLTTQSLIQLTNLGDINVDFLYITIKRNTSTLSNRFKVLVKQLPIPTNSSSSSSDSSSDNIPTNPGQQCLNQCSDHGQCTTQGCVCNSNWIGLDCSSQIIIVNPTINNTNPSTNYTIPSTNDDNKIFYAIISLVGLNELDSNGQIHSQYSFDQWVVSGNNSQSNSKYSSVASTSTFYSTSLVNRLDQSITTLNVSIDYFGSDQPVNITFANQILTMNPYSLKYSVNMSQYSFANSLNTLQLVMSASLESTTDNTCSSIETGNTVESESEFIKMQVNDHSLYGRFIKRGLIDGRIRQITNSVNAKYSSNTTSTSSKSQTYIGINIPQYQTLVQIDPDFSVLVDNRPATSESSNSICSQSSKKKLTKAQIAGIVIGSVALASIVCISLAYYIYIKRRDAALDKSISHKMETINSQK